MMQMTALKRLRSFAACERGNALLELGLVATLLTGTVTGLLEYGAVSGQASRLSAAARAAVEYAMKHPGDVTGITTVAAESGEIDPATLTVTVNQFCECPGQGTVPCTDACADGSVNNAYVTVSLSQPAESFLSAGFMPSFTLDRAATMRMR